MSLFSALPMNGFWFSKPKHWSIEDFISKKCYEVDNQNDQQRCIAVKEFLLQARKKELEQSNIKAEAAAISFVGGLIGVFYAYMSDPSDGTKELTNFISICFGLCLGPVYYKHFQHELE